MAMELSEQKKEVREEIKIINMKFMGRLPALTLSIVCFVLFSLRQPLASLLKSLLC